jgi:PAS domain-containing protein
MIQEEVGIGLERARTAPATGGLFEMDQRVIQRGGGVLWMLSCGRAKGGDPSRMIGISLDITERKRMEAVLRARLQAAVDLFGLGLYAWDPRDLTWDARVKSIWRLPPDAVVDYAIWRAGVHPEDLARVEAAIAACTDPGGGGVYHLEYRVRGADGVEGWAATRGRTVFQHGRRWSRLMAPRSTSRRPSGRKKRCARAMSAFASSRSIPRRCRHARQAERADTGMSSTGQRSRAQGTGLH